MVSTPCTGHIPMKYTSPFPCLEPPFKHTKVAVSLTAVRLSSRQKINFSETWHTKRVSYTTNKNGKIFLKYFFPAFLEARTHFGRTELFSIHFKAEISQYSGLSFIKTRYASKKFCTPFVAFIFIVIKACKYQIH